MKRKATLILCLPTQIQLFISHDKNDAHYKKLQTILRSIKKYQCPERTIVNILVIHVTHVFNGTCVPFYINGIQLFMLVPNLLFSTRHVSDILPSQ